MSQKKLEENSRTATKAQIKRASVSARSSMDALDTAALNALTDLYQQAATDLQTKILSYADRQGSLRLAVLSELLQQAIERLADLERARNELLLGSLQSAAVLGSAPMAATAASVSLVQISDDAVRFVRSFVAADGLQLSDRLWRLDQGAREAVSRVLQSAVVQGYSASQAVNELLLIGQTPGADLLEKTGAANARNVADEVKKALLTAEGNARDNALRVFRTELNRAHGEAYGIAAERAPDFGGFRYLLSPGHPRPDICDLHARVNLYGLGAGVYPDRSRLPWPAHPNTLSYFDVVFTDEISAADRTGQQTRTEWLQEQSAGLQEDVLGGANKQRAFAQGHLTENEFTTPWKVVQQRLNQRGITL